MFYAIYKEDMAIKPYPFYILERESMRFYFSKDPSFSYSIQEVFSGDDFHVFSSEKEIMKLNEEESVLV